MNTRACRKRRQGNDDAENKNKADYRIEANEEKIYMYKLLFLQQG